MLVDRVEVLVPMSLSTWRGPAAGGEPGGLDGPVPEHLEGLDLVVLPEADKLTIHYLLLVVERLEVFMVLPLSNWRDWTYWYLL